MRVPHPFGCFASLVFSLRLIAALSGCRWMGCALCMLIWGGGSVLCGPAGGGVEQGGKNGRGKTVGRARVGGLPEEAATGDWLDEAAEAEAEDRLEAAGGWDAPDGQDGPVQGLHWLTRGGVGWMTIGRRAGMCRRRCIQRWSAGRVAGYPPHYR